MSTKEKIYGIIENMLCDYDLITNTIKAIRREENFSDFALNV